MEGGWDGGERKKVPKYQKKNKRKIKTGETSRVMGDRRERTLTSESLEGTPWGSRRGSPLVI